MSYCTGTGVSAECESCSATGLELSRSISNRSHSCRDSKTLEFRPNTTSIHVGSSVPNDDRLF